MTMPNLSDAAQLSPSAGVAGLNGRGCTSQSTLCPTLFEGLTGLPLTRLDSFLKLHPAGASRRPGVASRRVEPAATTMSHTLGASHGSFLCALSRPNPSIGAVRFGPSGQ